MEGLPAAQSDTVIHLNAPFPAPVFLRFEGVEDDGRWELVWPECRITIPVACRVLILQTLSGQGYRLSLVDDDSTASTESAEQASEPVDDWFLLAHAMADSELVYEISDLLKRRGINAEPRPLSEFQEPPDPTDPLRVVYLWTYNAEREWPRYAEGDGWNVSPQWLLRIDEGVEAPPTPIPRFSSGMEQVKAPSHPEERDTHPRALDWFDWQRARQSPELLADFVERLRAWLRGDESTEEEDQDELGHRFRATAKVRLRSGPGTSYAQLPISPMPVGTEVVVLQQQGQWRQIRITGQTRSNTDGQQQDGPLIEGWVNRHFLQPIAEEDDDTSHEVLSRRSVLVCDHGGTLVLPEGDGPLTVDDIANADIVGCPNAGIAVRPCLHALPPTTGVAEHSSADGEAYLLSTVSGITDGMPPGTVHYRVRTPVMVSLGDDDDSVDQTVPDSEPTTHVDQLNAWIEQMEDIDNDIQTRMRAADALASAGDPRPGVGLNAEGLPDIDWVEIPGGEFLFGERNEPQRLPTYFMARYPITNDQYEAFITAGGYTHKMPWWHGLSWGASNAKAPGWIMSNRPRETVKWFEATAFCRWLSEKLGYEVRLPTEAEWEKAARGAEGARYPWGDRYVPGSANLDETRAKLGSNHLAQTSAVGLYPDGRSPYGIEDLIGNVWEWCTYSESNAEGRQSEQDISTHPLRGGSWDTSPDTVSATTRVLRPAAVGFDYFGFRVVCESPGSVGASA